MRIELEPQTSTYEDFLVMIGGPATKMPSRVLGKTDLVTYAKSRVSSLMMLVMNETWECENISLFNNMGYIFAYLKELGIDIFQKPYKPTSNKETEGLRSSKIEVFVMEINGPKKLITTWILIPPLIQTPKNIGCKTQKPIKVVSHIIIRRRTEKIFETIVVTLRSAVVCPDLWKSRCYS